LRRVVHAPIPWTRALMAALFAVTWLASAATGADSSDQMCADESPFGGWIRMQHLEQVRRGDQDGCDQVVNVFMTFDLVPSGLDMAGLKAAQAADVARWPKLSPQAREQMWNARLASQVSVERDATKLKYKVWSDGCHDIGGSQQTCDAPGGRASGEIALGEHTPTGFKRYLVTGLQGVHGVIFDPMAPSVKIQTSDWAGEPGRGGSSLLGQYGRAKCVAHAPNGADSVLHFVLTTDGFAALGVIIVPEPMCNAGNYSAGYLCIPPTACFRATDQTQLRQCAINPGKFVAVPFEGNQEQRYPHNAVVRSKISWKFCCGCGQIGGTHH